MHYLDGLRDYQLESRAAIVEALQEHQRIIYQLCTGGGKSVIIRSLIAERVELGEKVLLVVHDTRILKQLHYHCLAIGIESDRIGIIKAWKTGEYPLELWKPVQIAMIQTLFTSFEDMSGLFEFVPDFTVVDEGHHISHETSYYKLWEWFPDAQLLNVTATPARPNGEGFYHSDRKKLLFDRLITGPSKRQLIDRGFLPECETYFGLTPNLKGVAKRGGEYVVGGKNGLEERFNGADGSRLRGDIVRQWKTNVLERFGAAPTVCFGVSVQHIKDIAAEFEQNGIGAVALYGELLGAEQDEVLRSFISGKSQILCLCGMGQEGFDLSTIAKHYGLEAESVFCVIKALATGSLVKNCQIDGRVRGLDLMQWKFPCLPVVSNEASPEPDDVVLGGGDRIPDTAAGVLGGVEGLKQQLQSGPIQVRVKAMRKAIAQNRLDLLEPIAATDPSPQIRSLASAILENPQLASQGKLLYGVIIDCGNNFYQHGSFDSEHQWQLTGVIPQPQKTQNCPNAECKLVAIPWHLVLCPNCGTRLKPIKEKVESGNEDAELLPIEINKTAEMALLDKVKWAEFEALRQQKCDNLALAHVCAQNVPFFQMIQAARKCTRADGKTYRPETAYHKWVELKLIDNCNWKPTEDQLQEWAKMLGYDSDRAPGWIKDQLSSFGQPRQTPKPVLKPKATAIV